MSYVKTVIKPRVVHVYERNNQPIVEFLVGIPFVGSTEVHLSVDQSADLAISLDAFLQDIGHSQATTSDRLNRLDGLFGSN